MMNDRPVYMGDDGQFALHYMGLDTWVVGYMKSTEVYRPDCYIKTVTIFGCPNNGTSFWEYFPESSVYLSEAWVEAENSIRCVT